MEGNNLPAMFADGTGNDLLLLDSRGALISEINIGGDGGAVPEPLNVGSHLSQLPDGTLAVFDTTLESLVFFNPDGTLDRSKGAAGVLKIGGAGGFHPSYISWAGVTGVTRNGGMFAVDMTRQRIYVYNSNGAAGSVGVQDVAGNAMVRDYRLEFTFDNFGSIMVNSNPVTDRKRGFYRT